MSGFRLIDTAYFIFYSDVFVLFLFTFGIEIYDF